MERPSPLLLIAILVAGTLGWAARGPSQEVDRPPLLGRSADDALLALGPPSSIGPLGPDLAVWAWREDRRVVRSITVSDDLIVHVDLGANGLPEAPAEAVPAKGAYVGQPLAQLIGRLGNPDETRVREFHAEPGGGGPVVAVQSALVYGDRWMTVFDGRVGHIGAPPQPRKIYGPR